jgi:hypothetical protein
VVLSGYTPASSTTETGRHDIAEILLKMALNTKNQIKSNQIKSSSTGHSHPQPTLYHLSVVTIILGIVELCFW